MQTVHCVQNGQGVFARLYGLFANSDRAGNAASNDPATYYTCSGTATTGQPMFMTMGPPVFIPYA